MKAGIILPYVRQTKEQSRGSLHLYFGKSFEDFSGTPTSSSLRTQTCGSSSSSSSFSSSTTPTGAAAGQTFLPSSTNALTNYTRPAVNMFHNLTNPRPNYYCNLPHPSSTNPSSYTANPVTVMCNDAERAIAQRLEEAASRAKMAGVPGPLDVITGFERGCHLNGESNVILLIGSKTVHAIAHPSVDEMFNWAEILEQHLVDSSYHVTLCRVASCEGSTSSTNTSSRLALGLQASLHVQQWRICLVGEPSAGCQFIAQWRLDSIETVYTMESSCSSASSTAHPAIGSIDSMAHHYAPSGLGFTPPGQGCFPLIGGGGFNSSSSLSSNSSSSYQNDDRCILKTNRTAEKGLIGVFTFQVDGRRLKQLTSALSDFNTNQVSALTINDSSTSSLRHHGPSDAIDIRGGRTAPTYCEPPAVSSSSLSPPGRRGGGPCQLFRHFSHSPRTPPNTNVGCGGGNSSATAMASSLPNQNQAPFRGGESLFNEKSSGSSRKHSSCARKQSSASRRHLLKPGASQTLGRSEDIKIPTARFPLPSFSKTPSDNFGLSAGPRRSFSTKVGSAEATCGDVCGGSSSEACSSVTMKKDLFYPSVKVGGGTITSLVPGPPPARKPDLLGMVSPHLNPSPQPPLPRMPHFLSCECPAPPPNPKIHKTTSAAASGAAAPSNAAAETRGVFCDSCRRAKRGVAATNMKKMVQLQKRRSHVVSSSTSPSAAEVGIGAVFAVDEDVAVEHLLPLSRLTSVVSPLGGRRKMREAPRTATRLSSRRTSRWTQEAYGLHEELCRTVSLPWESPRPGSLRRSCTPDECSTRRRLLKQERIFAVLGVGDGSPLDRLLSLLLTTPPCVILLSFAPPPFSDPLRVGRLREKDFKWYIIHRPGSCCPNCCLWNTPLLADLDLQRLVDRQNHLLDLRRRLGDTDDYHDSGYHHLCFYHDAADCCYDIEEYGEEDDEGVEVDATASSRITCHFGTSRLFIWQFLPRTALPHSGRPPSCSCRHPNRQLQLQQTPTPGLSRPWSVLYLGLDDEIGDDYGDRCSGVPELPRCILCGCSVPIAPESSSTSTNPVIPQPHAYANMNPLRGKSSPSKLGGILGGLTAGTNATTRDCLDGCGVNRLFGTALYSPLSSTSQASSSSPGSPNQAYYNLMGAGVVGCAGLNPLHNSSQPPLETAAYANISHMISTASTTANSISTASSWASPQRHFMDDIPDEIRQPKRNYALVDLRPSPANSISVPAGESALVVSSPFKTPMDIGDRLDISAATSTTTLPASGTLNSGSGGGDSSASTLHTNASTSSSTISPGRFECKTTARTPPANGGRRRSSHSISTVLPAPALNYVHILSTSSVANAGSTAAPLLPTTVAEKPTSTAVGAAAAATTCYSSSCSSASSASSIASSSEKEQHAPQIGSDANRVPEDGSVAYAQIDFARTRALNAANEIATSGSLSSSSKTNCFRSSLNSAMLSAAPATAAAAGSAAGAARNKSSNSAY